MKSSPFSCQISAISTDRTAMFSRRLICFFDPQLVRLCLERLVHFVGQKFPDAGHVPVGPRPLDLEKPVHAAVGKVSFIETGIHLPDMAKTGLHVAFLCLRFIRGHRCRRLPGAHRRRLPVGDPRRGLTSPPFDEPVDAVEERTDQKNVHHSDPAARAARAARESEAPEEHSAEHPADESAGHSPEKAAAPEGRRCGRGGCVELS